MQFGEISHYLAESYPPNYRIMGFSEEESIELVVTSDSSPFPFKYE